MTIKKQKPNLKKKQKQKKTKSRWQQYSMQTCFFYNYVIFYPKTCQESHCNGCIPQSMATCNPTMASRLYQLVTCCALARLLQLLGWHV